MNIDLISIWNWIFEKLEFRVKIVILYTYFFWYLL